MEFVKEHSQSKLAAKFHVGTLIGTLTTCTFDGTRTMHQHMTEMINTTTKFRSMGMEVSESFLVQFVINSHAPKYGPF